jgi:hypothetical protein
VQAGELQEELGCAARHVNLHHELGIVPAERAACPPTELSIEGGCEHLVAFQLERLE